MTNFILVAAKRIPSKIRKTILEEDLIGKNKILGSNPDTSSFEYLFDIYEFFIDIRGEHDDFKCSKCRQFVLQQWIEMEPYLKNLENENA